MKYEFKEEQKFSQWWLWVLFIIVGLLLLLALYRQLFLDEPVGDNPMSNTGLVVFSVAIFTLMISFYFMHLKTKINEEEINILFFPFTKRVIKWKDVKKAEVLKYGFVGGWGIRLWTKYGTVYNTGGNKGLAITLVNGKKLLIGTRQELALKEILKQILAAKGFKY